MIAGLDSLDDVLAELPGISLSELQEQAALLTRRDRKYLIPATSVGPLLAGLGREARVLEIDDRRAFGYETPYFDSDDFDAYFSALRRRPQRFKVRTRLYTDSGLCHLEVKTRDVRGRTVKQQSPHPAGELELLSGEERAWLRHFPQVAAVAGVLRHRVTTTYTRSTLLLPGETGRATIDKDLGFALPDGRRLILPGIAIVETKAAGKPTPLDHLLWRHGFRPQGISKFALGLSLLTPHLPANRWHRLRQHLAAIAEEPAPVPSAPLIEQRELAPSPSSC